MRIIALVLLLTRLACLTWPAGGALLHESVLLRNAADTLIVASRLNSAYSIFLLILSVE